MNTGLKSLSIWKKVLAESYGEDKARELEGKIRTRYESLYKTRPHFKQSASRTHLDTKLLPGIAFYQVVKEDLGNQVAALSCVDELFALQTAHSNERRQLMLMRFLPNPFSFLSLASRLQVAMAFPKEGWTMKTVINNKEVLGFDTTHCLYVDVLTTYGVPELAPSFCKTDEYLMKDIPYARFERTMTLGQGDPVCNFRYIRVIASKA